MTAAFNNNIVSRTNRVSCRKIAKTSRRTRSLIATLANYKNWLLILLNQFRRHNTNNSVIPISAIHHQNPIISHIVRLLASFVKNLVLNAAAFDIQFFQLFASLQRLQSITCRQHIQSILRRFQSTRRVHSRAQTKPQMSSINLLRLNSRHRHQCLQTGTLLLFQDLQAPIDIRPIFIRQRNYVANRSQRHQIQ